MADSAPSRVKDIWVMRDGVGILNILDYLKYNALGNGDPFSSGFVKLAFSRLLTETRLDRFDNLLYGKNIAEWDLLAHGYYNTKAPYWKKRQIFDRLKDINIPTYHTAGMKLDGSLMDAVENFMEIESHSDHKKKHHLYLGYWNHGSNTPYYGGVYMNPFIKTRYDAIMAYYLKGDRTDFLKCCTC